MHAVLPLIAVTVYVLHTAHVAALGGGHRLRIGAVYWQPGAGHEARQQQLVGLGDAKRRGELAMRAIQPQAN
eukprot:4907147-Pleurochrysis_carterae.AAC.1